MSRVIINEASQCEGGGGHWARQGGGAEWNVGGRLVKYLADNRFHRYSGMQQGSLPANSGPLGRVFSILFFFFNKSLVLDLTLDWTRIFL